jgi:hypothetical protein
MNDVRYWKGEKEMLWTMYDTEKAKNKCYERCAVLKRRKRNVMNDARYWKGEKEMLLLGQFTTFCTSRMTEEYVWWTGKEYFNVIFVLFYESHALM